jgi:hypothetical protein
LFLDSLTSIDANHAADWWVISTASPLKGTEENQKKEESLHDGSSAQL